MPRARIEPVERQQLPTMVGDQMDRVEDVREHRLAHEVGEREPGERQLRPHVPLATSACIFAENRSPIPDSRCRYGPAQKQPLRAWIPNRSLSTATTKLACKAPAVTQPERHDRQPLYRGITEHLDVRVRAPGPQRTPREIVLTAADLLGADHLLEREHQPGADRLDDGRRTRLLADRRVRVICVRVRADEQHRAAAGHRRDRCCEAARAWRRAHQACRVRRRTCAVRGTPHPCPVMSIGRYGPPPRSPSMTAHRGGAAPPTLRSTSVTMPVTFEAAEKLPIFTVRSACRRSSLSR